MPLGAFIADKKIMDSLSFNPVLGHINTFGGHPVSCAAGLAAFSVLLKENYIADIKLKEQLFVQQLQHPLIKNISSFGLMMAVEFENFDLNKKIIDACIEKGVFTDWFLFAAHALRIVPPLNISDEEINRACSIIIRTLNSL